VTRLDDAALARLREAVLEPDLSGTRYRLLEVAGRGGMGTVYVVEDTALSRKVALKVLELPGGPLEPRLRREAQVLARLEHPGMVPVHDVGTLPDGRAWYTMKLVDGERLDRYLKEGVSLAERLRLFLRICEAVAFAHAQGVLHRDLKPQNVMIGAFGEVLVLDWGLAKLQGEDDRGARLGTDGFISPEQAAGAGVDERADVYSLGALLRSMLAGPAPNRVEAIARKATAADRTLRYPSVRALADDVSRYLDGAAVSAFPEGPLRRAARLASRHRVALGIVLAYLVGRSVMFFFVGR